MTTCRIAHDQGNKYLHARFAHIISSSFSQCTVRLFCSTFVPTFPPSHRPPRWQRCTGWPLRGTYRSPSSPPTRPPSSPHVCSSWSGPPTGPATQCTPFDDNYVVGLRVVQRTRRTGDVCIPEHLRRTIARKPLRRNPAGAGNISVSTVVAEFVTHRSPSLITIYI